MHRQHTKAVIDISLKQYRIIVQQIDYTCIELLIVTINTPDYKYCVDVIISSLNPLPLETRK